MPKGFFHFSFWFFVLADSTTEKRRGANILKAKFHAPSPSPSLSHSPLSLRPSKPLQNTQFTFVIVMLINSLALKKSSEHAVGVAVAVAIAVILKRRRYLLAGNFISKCRTLTSWPNAAKLKLSKTCEATITKSSVPFGSLPTCSLTQPFTLVKTFQWPSIFNSA